VAAALVGAVGLLGGCGDDGAAAVPKGSRSVVFAGPGETRLVGRELGRGSVALVLAHGAGTTMESWYAPMEAFADAGYRVLAFDARGVGGSTGALSYDPAARAADIEATLQHVRDEGVSRVVVMGSSLGAQAALIVAGREDVAAVVGVSPATVPEGLDAITAPALFVASAGDRGPAQNARMLARHFGRPARIVSGSVHGADLFADHPQAARAVVGFLTGVVPARS
jgi:pimeloyl-ACP methyl ester carboxylesterase